MEESAAESAPNPEAPRLDRATVGAILRPAILLWLFVHLVSGVAAMLQMLAVNSDAWASPFSTYQLLGDAGQILCFLITVKMVWPALEARRVFGRLPKRGIEFCIVVAVASGLLFKMWLNWLADLTGGYGGTVGASVSEVAWSLVTYAVLPAVAEEWMCRGLMLHRFRQVMSLPMANAMQAMLFASMHAYTGYMTFYFLFGFVIGILRLQAGVLWPCMLLHFVWNAGWKLTEYGYL